MTRLLSLLALCLATSALAAPPPGHRYEEGSVMSDFYSKLLMRTFPSVMFVGHVAVMGN